MADSDKEYRINITTTADNAGSMSAIEEFEKIQQRLSGVYQGTRDVRQIWMEMDRIIPGTGQALEAAMTGPLGIIVGLGAALDFTVTALKKFNEEMDKILDEDLTGPLDQANAIAQAWTGIADAAAKAVEQFNSAQGIFDRAQKGIDSDKGLSPQEKLQAELSNKMNEAANAEAQAEAAKRKAESYKLPATNEQAQAEAKAEAEVAAQRRKQGDDALAESQRIGDAEVSGISSVTTKGFWEFAQKQILEHGLKFWKYQTGGEMTRELDIEGKRQIDIANAGDAEGASLDARTKEREAARKDAESKAADAAKLRLDAQWEANPNNAGSLAAKLAQQKTYSGGEAAVASDFSRIASDLATHGPKSQQTIQDMRDALRDATAMIKALSAAGDDVKELQREIQALRAQVTAQGSNGTFK